MKALASQRNHRFAPVILLLLALLITGGLYAALAPSNAAAETSAATTTAEDNDAGYKLFQANCATCHGPSAAGTTSADGKVSTPSLIGVGAASANFQLSTGRMPMQTDGAQAIAKPPQFDEEQIRQLVAFVASLGPGPGIPTAEQVDPALGDSSRGSEIFRTNCAMCHNAVGAGGALSDGKFAPPLLSTTPQQIFEAMATGPQSMPIFNDANLTPDEKRDVISYIVDQREGSAGGDSLGSLGPVSEGLWAWIVGMGLLIGAAVWIGAKSS